jgi:hypothetical protein
MIQEEQEENTESDEPISMEEVVANSDEKIK